MPLAAQKPLPLAAAARAMTTWGAYLNTQDLLGRADAIAGAAASAADDGVLMQQGLKNASKCRECSKTLDVGTAAYFNKEGEPGRKITCKECHDAKAPPDGDEAAAPVTEKKRPAKKRRVVARLTPEVLVEAKGIAMVYKAFPKVSFKGRGHEVDDLRKLLNKCARRTRHPAGAHTPAGASTRRPTDRGARAPQVRRVGAHARPRDGLQRRRREAREGGRRAIRRQSAPFVRNSAQFVRPSAPSALL